MAVLKINNMLLLPFVAYFLQFFQPSQPSETLYSETDPVVILNDKNLKSTLYNAKNAWMIEFYSSWCGHCIRFAPIWKALAEDVKGWQDIIKLAVLDCSKDENFNICHDFDIHAFPTLKFLNASTSTGIGVKYAEHRKADTMRESIVDFIDKHKSKPPHWPDFTSPSLEWIYNLFPSRSHPNVHYLVLIFEDKDSYVGREVILDFAKFENVMVKRVTKEEQNENVMAKFGVDTFPSMYVMYPNHTRHRILIEAQATRENYRQAILGLGSRGGSEQRVVAEDKFEIVKHNMEDTKGAVVGGERSQADKPVNGDHAEQKILNGEQEGLHQNRVDGGQPQMKQQLQRDNDQPQGDLDGQKEKGVQEEKQDNGKEQGDQQKRKLSPVEQILQQQKHIESRDQDPVEIQTERKHIFRNVPVYMQDLESTLHYSLRHEIALHNVIKGNTLTALKKYVAVLSKFFPGRMQVTSYLKQLHYWLEDNSDEEITSEDWLDFVNEKYDPEKAPDTYLPARLMWVGCKGSQEIYRGYPCGLWTLFHSLTVSAATTHKYYRLDEKLEVLPAMSAYIAEYFGCRECAENFGKMAVTIDSTVKTPDDAVLWLWRAHNQANKRLHGDKTEDPEHPKIQFPPMELCPFCKESEDSEWQESKVLTFLKDYYHINNIALDQLSRVMDSEVKVRNIQTVAKHRLQREHELRLEELKNRRLGIFGLGLSGMDMSMCVLLHGFCIALVFLPYIIFCKRRRQKSMKHIV
ncbi:sulfhydryl oxidase 2-like isoform X2 [Ptychodera flava]|uniref:sulfhydryl oxidase 2-like isoform X2 n=1 Tax=Ptychodera flava TaxID=63121 RepID=UPI00396A9CC4